MDRVSAANFATISGKRFWQDQTLPSTSGTELSAQYHNDVQEMLVRPVEGVGLTPTASVTPTDATGSQLFQAIQMVAGATIPGAAITANTTLTPQQVGVIKVSAAGGNVVLTLPQSATMGGLPMRYRVVRTDTTWANSVTFALHAGDASLTGTLPTLNQFYPTADLVGDGVASWAAFAPGTSSLGTSGWASSPGGAIRMWGSGVTTTGSGDVITFPAVFPTACEVVLVNEAAAGGSWAAGAATLYGAGTRTTANFQIWAKNVASGGAITAGAGISYGYEAKGF